MKMPEKGNQAKSESNSRQPHIRQFTAYTPVLSIKFFLALLAFSSVIVAVYIQVAKNLTSSLYNLKDGEINRADVIIVGDEQENGYLDHVVETFQYHDYSMSFSKSLNDKQTDTTYLEDFKVIWSHDYPFIQLKNLKPYQRVNHFPGVGFIANKVSLSTTPGLPNTLKAFRLPEESAKFVSYYKQHPQKQWIQKTSSHRGISITEAELIDLNPIQSTIVQEFLANPLLIDGKKFDIGVYVALTSVNPIRAYIYDQETLMRFCAKPYIDATTRAFNSSDIDSFVVGDDYTPIWLMPSLVKYYIGTNLSMKETIKTYLKSIKDINPEVIWIQIEDTIKNVLKYKESQIAKLTKLYQESNKYSSDRPDGSQYQFFEMLRFDFIIDENLQVYLMEANMSPNLSSRHFPPNKFIYQEVLRSLFSLVGLTQFDKRHLLNNRTSNDEFEKQSRQEAESQYRNGVDLIIQDKELSVYQDLCSSDECHMNCAKQDCQVCYFCLTKSDKLHLKRAIYEHKNRWDFKRLLPSTLKEDSNLQLSSLTETKPNILHTQWFQGKCYLDKSFCSIDLLT